MKQQFSSWRLNGAAVLTGLMALAGCSGGGDLAGIEGTGSPTTVESVGSVTAYSSVIVNGVRYDISSADIEINGQTGAFEEDIQLGMVVRVEAELEADGTEGQAQSVTYERQLRAVIDEVISLDINRTRLILLGQQVDVSDDIVFANLSFETLGAGIAVEVSGFTDADGRLVATRLARAETAEIDLKSRVAALDRDQQRFTLGSLVVDYTNVLFVGGTQDNLEVGGRVEIKGGERDAQGVLAPQEIHLKAEQVPENGQQLSLEGVVGQFTAINNFRLRDLRLDASGAEISGGTSADIGSGVHLAAEGEMRNGVLQVERVRLLLAGLTRVRGMVDAVAPERGELTLLGNRYSVSPFTGFEDRSPVANRFIGLNAISAGDSVEVFARYIDGELIATRIRRLDRGGQDDSISLRGPVTGVEAEGSFSVMGISVDARDAGGAALTDGLSNGDLVVVEGRMTGSRSMQAEQVSVPERPPCPETGNSESGNENCAPDLPIGGNEPGSGLSQRPL